MINGAIHQPISCKACARVAIVRSSGVVSSQFTCVDWSIKLSPILSRESIGVLLANCGNGGHPHVPALMRLMNIDSNGPRKKSRLPRPVNPVLLAHSTAVSVT